MGIEQPMNLLELQHKHSNDTNNLDSSQKQELIDGMVSEMQANLKLANTADTLGQFELDAVDVAEFSRMYEEKLVSFLSTSRTSDELLKVQLGFSTLRDFDFSSLLDYAGVNDQDFEDPDDMQAFLDEHFQKAMDNLSTNWGQQDLNAGQKYVDVYREGPIAMLQNLQRRR